MKSVNKRKHSQQELDVLKHMQFCFRVLLHHLS